MMSGSAHLNGYEWDDRTQLSPIDFWDWWRYSGISLWPR